jgi:hypothetical protein
MAPDKKAAHISPIMTSRKKYTWGLIVPILSLKKIRDNAAARNKIKPTAEISIHVSGGIDLLEGSIISRIMI